MGSGEAAPTMAKVHRALFERFGDEPAPAAIIDTPYGFQENADELSARLVEFFRTNLGRSATVASYRSRSVDPATLAAAVARIREARYVFAGPGSPSYALRTWAGSPIPEALADKLERGGIVTMASAAALTLGVVTIPVYEIYKVGEDPHWLEGLDLLGRATGLRAAVVPHYDNAEGGTHDTRFCYLGERRLRILEAALPEGAFILGVDGHTALVLDLERGTASVAGLGGVTVRVGGRSSVLPAGSEVAIEGLAEIARELAAGIPVDVEIGSANPETAGRPGRGSGASSRAALPVRDAMVELEAAFVHALDEGDVHGAVEALLELDEAIVARIRSGEDSPDLDNARAVFRALIARLGERAEAGTRDPRAVVGPFVTALLEIRSRARAARDWATADLIRDRLRAAGVEVRDTVEGSSWLLEPTAVPPTAARPDPTAGADTLGS
jgi:cyanophycinase-like exopeptidase